MLDGIVTLINWLRLATSDGWHHKRFLNEWNQHLIHARQQGTADNDTIILTLEDIYNDTPDLDKRVEWPLSPKQKKHEMITVPLVKEGSGWFIKVPVDKSRAGPSQQHNFEFQIDTYGVCSWVPLDAKFFKEGRSDTEWSTCPGRSYSKIHSFVGKVNPSRIAIASGVTWEGRLVRKPPSVTPGPPDHGTLGLSLSDSTVPGNVHTLPNLLKIFQSRVFALSLSEEKFYIGGYDKSRVLEYYTVVKTSNLHQPWQIGHLRIFVDDIEIELHRNTENDHIIPIVTAFDSSTPYIYGPPTEVGKILVALEDAHYVMHRARPVVYFQWEDQTKWPFMFDIGQRDSLFRGDPDVEGWVLGTEFTYAYYMAYIIDDANKPWVGIGWAHGCRPPPPQYRSPTPENRPPTPENRPPTPGSSHEQWDRHSSSSQGPHWENPPPPYHELHQ